MAVPQPFVLRMFSALLRWLPPQFDHADASNLRETFELRLCGRGARRGLRFIAAEYASLLWLIAHGWALTLTPALFRPRDVTQAIRRLRAAPAFAAGAIATVALAVGANTLAFTLLSRLVMAPLPYPQPEKLVAIDHAAPGVGMPSLGLSLGLYWEYTRLRSLDAVAIYYVGEQTLTVNGADAERLRFLHASPSIGRVLGIVPAAGRWFTDAEGMTGASPVTVLSHDVWSRRFGARADVVGQLVHLDGVAHEVVGVLARGFAFPDQGIAYVVPFRLDPSLRRVAGFNYQGVARLAPHGSVEQLTREQQVVIGEVPTRFAGDPESAGGLFADGRLTASPVPLHERVLGRAARLLWLVVAAAVVGLLVALGNLANLMLVRAESRRLEFAVRRALGGGAAAMVSTLAAEALVVALAGGLAGVCLAVTGLRAVVTNSGIDWPRLPELTFGASAMVFASVLTAAIVIVLTTMPLLRLGRRESAGALRAGRGHTAGHRARQARYVLLASQVGLALVLLLAAGLLSRSVERLRRVDPGFDPESRLAFTVALPRATYPDRRAVAAFNDDLAARLRHLPGVQAVALGSVLPLQGQGITNPVEVFGRPDRAAGDRVSASERIVSPSYFDTMGIRLVRGKLFEATTLPATGPPVAIVNEAFATAYFPGTDPLGQRFRTPNQAEWMTVVGVVGNTATERMSEPEPARKFYLPSTAGRWRFVLRAVGDPLALVPDVRRLVTTIDPGLAVSGVDRMSDLVRRSDSDVSFAAFVFLLTSGGALLLGIIGVYGVLACVVEERRDEIGLRVALGARPSSVVRLVVRQTGAAVLAGAAAGLAAGASVSGWLGEWLVGTSPTDPATFLVVPAIIIVVAVVACWWPARRATRVDPIGVLRR